MPRLIDIESAIRTKFPQQTRRVPRWVFRVAEWLVCQKQMNHILVELDGKQGVDFADGMTRILDVSYSLSGLDGVADDGRYIFVSNHPLGAFDGISYIKVLGERFAGLKVIVNDLLMYIEPLQSVFLPVNTLGRQRRADMEAIEAAYRSDDIQLMTFPAGFCSRWIGGRVQDIEWKKSVIAEAVNSHRDIVPMHFEGRNSVTFYAVEWLRRKLGMKFNVGLLLLPWQMVKTSRGKHYAIRVGRPIPWQTFDASRTPVQWAAWLRQQCYALRDAHPDAP